jgi:hypothetical protein
MQEPFNRISSELIGKRGNQTPTPTKRPNATTLLARIRAAVVEEFKEFKEFEKFNEREPGARIQ